MLRNPGATDLGRGAADVRCRDRRERHGRHQEDERPGFGLASVVLARYGHEVLRCRSVSPRDGAADARLRFLVIRLRMGAPLAAVHGPGAAVPSCMTTTITAPDFADSLAKLMTEFLDGGPGDWVFFTDGPETGGVAGVLRRISAPQAFGGVSPNEPHTPAAVVSHLLYSADLFARALRGDHSCYANADWAASWNLPDDLGPLAEVRPDDAWAELTGRLLARAEDARAALADCNEWAEELTRTGAIGNVCHFAYHLAQLVRLVHIAERPA